MTFAQILPDLLAGRRARLRKRAPDDPRAFEYFRLPDGWESELELVAERRSPNAGFSQYIRRFPLRRFELERNDWELLDDERQA
ncbi:MAG: hypothetical protein IJE97_12210 [Thermoguttaceae bacterium]|nr:hypothetical protein [Thermoguttaceae bacterium]MBQ2790389.1 hypothetical protein [Thermoguttaceae bacterium]MBR4833908.1 hypothetical protein [Thermoguttaceae bacterium]